MEPVGFIKLNVLGVFKVEWLDTQGNGQEDLFDDLETVIDFMNLIQDCCCMADAYMWRGSNWVHL